MRNIQLSLETANRWYNGQDQELKDLAVQTYPELAKKELLKSWEELGKIRGYYIETDSIITNGFGMTNIKNHNIFATKEQAEASIALAQLSQLLAVYNDGKKESAYSIRVYEDGNPDVFFNSGLQSFLSFKDEATAELFLKNFKDLILTAKPLL